MKKKLLTLLFYFFVVVKLASQGMLFNAETNAEYKKSKQKHLAFGVDSAALPAKVDFSQYLPKTINQEKWGTCVGISTAYYMRTLLEAKLLSITDPKKIEALSFSPSYLYNAIKSPTNTDCYEGTELTKALSFLRDKGAARLSEQPYPYCGENIGTIILKDQTRIMDYVKVFGLNSATENVILASKKAIAEGSPLLVGVLTTKSLQKMHFTSSLWARIKLFLGFGLSENEDFRLWKPERSVAFKGDHAICIIGYDDKRYGGAFQAVNSWGNWWGESGKFWIRYSDFKNVAKYCFQPYLSENTAINDIEIAADIKLHFGSFSIDNEVPFQKITIKNKNDSMVNLLSYSLLKPQKSKTKYFFEANLKKQGYLYLLGKNDAVLAVQRLFPNTDSTSAFLGASTKFLLPSPQFDKNSGLWVENHYQLIPPTGHEYWLFLFSKNELNINQIAQEIEKEGGNSFPEATLKVLGAKMVPSNQINYNNKKIAFTVKAGHKGAIVPVLIDFDHYQLEPSGSMAF